MSDEKSKSPTPDGPPRDPLDEIAPQPDANESTKNARAEKTAEEQESMIERAQRRAEARQPAAPKAPSTDVEAETEDTEDDPASAAPTEPAATDTAASESAVSEVAARQEAAANAEPSAASPPSVAPTPVKVKSGRALAFLSLLLALGAAGGAGYLYYELIHKQPFDARFSAIDARVQGMVSDATRHSAASTEALASDLSAELDTLRGQFRTFRGQQNESIDSALAQQQQRLESTERSLIESLNRVANQAPPTQEEWKLAELEYLLRIANHRVLMEKDADGALRLLETADGMLAGLDDFGLHEVRAQLAEEMLALKRLGQNDVQGLFLRLEAVKRNLEGLPLDVPEYLRAAPEESLAVAEESAPVQRSALAALADAMGTFFRFRELQTELGPLRSPKEITYLEMNLRLMIEQAQLAALRGEAEVFEQSLDNAVDWLTEHLDADAPSVLALIEELTALRQISVVREMPDISGSLRTLVATERGAS